MKPLKFAVGFFGCVILFALLVIFYIVLGLFKQVPVEVFGFLVLVFIFICWLIFLGILKVYNLVGYDIQDDTSRKGEPKGRAGGSTVPAVSDVTGQGGSSERRLLPSEIAIGNDGNKSEAGKDSDSRRTPGNRLRKLFTRR